MYLFYIDNKQWGRHAGTTLHTFVVSPCFVCLNIKYKWVPVLLFICYHCACFYSEFFEKNMTIKYR